MSCQIGQDVPIMFSPRPIEGSSACPNVSSPPSPPRRRLRQPRPPARPLGDRRAARLAKFRREQLCGAEPALQDLEAASPDRARADRPENLAQVSGKAESAPGIASALEADDRVCLPGDAPVIARRPQGDAAIQRHPATLDRHPPGSSTRGSLAMTKEANARRAPCAGDALARKIWRKSLERLNSAPGTAPALEADDLVCVHGDAPVIARRPQGDAAIQRHPATPGSPPPGLFDPGVARDDEGSERSASPLRRRCARPENSLQGLEKVESAPGTAPALEADDRVCVHGDAPVIARRPQGDAAIQRHPATPGSPPPGLFDPGVARDDEGSERSASFLRRRYVRPENPVQVSGNVESAPGIGLSSETAEAAPAGPVSTPGLFLSLLSSAVSRQSLRAGLSGLRAGTYGVAHQPDGGDFPFAAPTGRARPQNMAQRLENMESAPGKRGLDQAGSGSLPSRLILYPIGPGGVARTVALRSLDIPAEPAQCRCAVTTRKA